jgi:hypothetical protein
MRCRWLSGLLWLAALTGSLPALGQDSSSAEEAARIKAAADEFDAGRRAFKARDYDTAASHFENADRDAPAPEALRLAIRSRLEAKQPARAAMLAASALARYPEDKATVKAARQVLSSVEKQLHRLAVSCSPACTLLVDRKLLPFPQATAVTLYLDPGAHSITASWPGERSKTESVSATANHESDLAFVAPPPKAEPVAEEKPVIVAPPPEEKPHSGLPRGVFFAGLEATAVLGGVSLWSTLDMRANPGHDKVRQDCAGQDESCPTYQDGLRRQRRTNILLAVTAGVAVATGVVGVLTDWAPPPQSGQGPRLRPSVAFGGSPREGWLVGAEGAF